MHQKTHFQAGWSHIAYRKHRSSMANHQIERKVCQQFDPRSPDLKPYDYFLWGHLKTTAHNPLPNTIDDLKTNIVRDY